MNASITVVYQTRYVTVSIYHYYASQSPQGYNAQYLGTHAVSIKCRKNPINKPHSTVLPSCHQKVIPNKQQKERYPSTPVPLLTTNLHTHS